jgi:putative phosphonate catabolism associated alcohol dehydrogenase
MSICCEYVSFDDTVRGFSHSSGFIPSLQPHEILVKILYTTLCRSDIYTYEGRRKEKSPTILGHEIVGTVAEFGNSHSRIDLRGNQIRIGDRITWAIYASDPEDIHSKRGIPQKAADLFKYGHEKVTPESCFHGGLSEYIILRKNTPVVLIKDDMPNSVAALINCSVATVSGSFRLAGSVKDKTVLISGVGMLGTIACAMAKHANAKKVIAFDQDQKRATNALSFGADHAIGSEMLESTANDAGISNALEGGVDILLEFTGQPKAIMAAIAQLNVGGKAILVGSTFRQEDIRINAEMIIRKLLTIQGLHNYNEKDLIAAVAFMEAASHLYKFESFVEKGFSLSETTAAFEYAVKNNPYRVGIDLSLK